MRGRPGHGDELFSFVRLEDVFRRIILCGQSGY